MTTLSERFSEAKRAALMSAWGVLREQVIAIAPRLAEQMPLVKVEVFRDSGSSSLQFYVFNRGSVYADLALDGQIHLVAIAEGSRVPSAEDDVSFTSPSPASPQGDAQAILNAVHTLSRKAGWRSRYVQLRHGQLLISRTDHAEYRGTSSSELVDLQAGSQWIVSRGIQGDSVLLDSQVGSVTIRVSLAEPSFSENWLIRNADNA